MTTRLDENEIKLLMQSNEDQLLEQLGLRTAVVTRRLEQSSELFPKIVASDVTSMGIKDDLKLLGRQILKRWERSAYDIVCGGMPEDDKARLELTKALGLGEAAAIGALSTALIGVGLMPALAPVLAAILVKKFFRPAYGTFCDFWKSKLPPA
jgi:hypothetical protein